MDNLRTVFSLVMAYLRLKPFNTALNLLLLALGIAAIVVVMLLSAEANDKLRRDSQGIDLVVSGKGSPLQIVLSSVYHIDIPTGNIPLVAAQKLMKNPLVKRAIPMSLGDSFKGFRIVGTEKEYAELYKGELASGVYWMKPLQAVLGARVARESGLTLGAQFSGAHGLTSSGSAHQHKEHPFTVVGILAPTGSVLDRLILVNLESVWDVHDIAANGPSATQNVNALAAKISAMSGMAGKAQSNAPAELDADADNEHEDHDSHDTHSENREITALLIQYATPLAAVALPRLVNAEGALQAASPASETTRMFSLLGIGIDTIKLFALAMIVCAGLSIFIALSNALEERRADLALLRILGAGRNLLLQLVVAEGVTLTLAGVILGLLFGHVGTELLGHFVASSQQLEFTGWLWLKDEVGIVFGALLLGVLAALVPAIRAYRGDIATTLMQR